MWPSMTPSHEPWVVSSSGDQQPSRISCCRLAFDSRATALNCPCVWGGFKALGLSKKRHACTKPRFACAGKGGQDQHHSVERHRHRPPQPPGPSSLVVMNISGIEATGSGRSRAEDSEARAQVAGYGARPGSRSRHPGRAKPKRHL